MQFGIFDKDIWHLYLDVRILLGLVKKHLDKNSVRRVRIIKSLESMYKCLCRKSEAMHINQEIV